MMRSYETHRRDGKIPATWEVIHATAWGGERRDSGNIGRPRETLISPSAIRRRPS
jgi:hypothetical protein